MAAPLSAPARIAAWAASDPARPFVTEIGGRSVTYGEFHQEALQWASALQRLGLGPGDTIVSLTEPSLTALTLWIGAGWNRTVEVTCNTEFHGAILTNLVNDAGATTVVVSEPLLDRILAVSDAVPMVKRVIVTDGPAPVAAATAGPFEILDSTALLAAATPDAALEPPGIWDTSLIVYTSGTTGPSKGVRMPWGQQRQNGIAFVPPEDVADDECFYSPFPMYHGLGRAVVVTMAEGGGSLVIRRRFSATEYWADVREHGCTITCFLGPMGPFLAGQPEDAGDADNPLRRAIMLPVIPTHREFAQRFGIKLRTAFGMTEVGTPFATDWGGITDHRSCGQLRPGFEARLVDDHDFDVGAGAVGELVLRHREPWTMCDGYVGLADRTAAAWRNGWFHTGDAFRTDDAGNYFFVDRMKDSIRRRGENISSFEVEGLVCAHPAVAEAVALPIPSPFGEDDVKVCVVLAPGANIDEATLVEDLTATTPKFMVPRYVEFVTALPRTEATGRVRKALLRENALNERTWDRDAQDPVATG